MPTNILLFIIKDNKKNHKLLKMQASIKRTKEALERPWEQTETVRISYRQVYSIIICIANKRVQHILDKRHILRRNSYIINITALPTLAIWLPESVGHDNWVDISPFI